MVTNNAEPNVQNSVENEGDYVWAYNNYFGETNEANGARDTPKNEPKALGEEAVTYFENNELWDDAAVEALREASGVEGMNVSYTDPEPEMHPEVGSAPAAEPETTAEETTAEETTAEETTAAPTTEAPTTAAPTTEAPTTAAPTTAAPAASTGTQATESGGIGVLPIVLIVAIVCVAAGIVVYLKKKGKTDSK